MHINANMAKPWVPSRLLLSTFSRSLQSESTSWVSSQAVVSHHLNNGPRCLRLQRVSPCRPTQGGEGGKRQFSTSVTRSQRTVEEAKAKYRAGPFSWQAGVLFLAAGAGLVFYFRYEKARMERKRIAEAAKGVGRPKVGGDFELLDHNGQKFTAEDLKGKYALVYFGFTHCPDICPEELDKMAHMIDLVEEASPKTMRPIFITCDPARDTPAVVKSYLAEFHPALIGLTGTWEQVKAVCKSYRVYFSTPPNVKPGQDYLVDHSIYFYLMDPEGDFVEAIGRQHSPQKAADIITRHIRDWRGKLDRS